MTASLIMSKNVQDFIELIYNHYTYPMIISIILPFMLFCKTLNQKSFILDFCYHSRGNIISCGVLTFIGAMFIGRFDYIAHFV